MSAGGQVEVNVIRLPRKKGAAAGSGVPWDLASR